MRILRRLFAQIFPRIFTDNKTLHGATYENLKLEWQFYNEESDSISVLIIISYILNNFISKKWLYNLNVSINK